MHMKVPLFNFRLPTQWYKQFPLIYEKAKRRKKKERLMAKLKGEIY